MPLSRLTILAAALAMALPLEAAAQQGAGKPGRQAFREVVKDLGVSRDDLRGCVAAMPQRPKQGEPDLALREERRDIFVACLMKANPDLTEEDVRKAMEKLRP